MDLSFGFDARRFRGSRVSRPGCVSGTLWSKLASNGRLHNQPGHTQVGDDPAVKASQEGDDIVQGRHAEMARCLKLPRHRRFPVIPSMKRKGVAAKRWTCPNCNSGVATGFCPSCGERPLRPHDLTLRGFLSQVAQACTSIDGPLLRSIGCLLTRPGALTVAYIKGQKKPYAPPFQLFLIANLLFFGMQSLTGSRIFSTPLEQHLQSDIWGGIAQRLLAHRPEMRHTTIGAYAPIFNQAVALNAKSLIVVMVPPFALLPALVFWKSHRPFVGHVVFSLHLYAFLLLLFCVSLAVVGGSMLFGGPGLESETFDHVLSVADLLVCATYLYIAAGSAYGAKGAFRVFQVAGLTVAAGSIFLGYRLALMLLTLSST
jgi:hypothetical protein